MPPGGEGVYYFSTYVLVDFCVCVELSDLFNVSFERYCKNFHYLSVNKDFSRLSFSSVNLNVTKEKLLSNKILINLYQKGQYCKYLVNNDNCFLSTTKLTICNLLGIIITMGS